MIVRHDYAYPLRVSAGAGQIGRASYPDHVDQMIRQLLLTSPGERVGLPEFGCGLRRMVFAGQSDALQATAKIQVQRAIDQWLGDQVHLEDVEVLLGADPANGLDEGELLVTLSYTLIDTMTAAQLQLKVV